MRNISGQEKGYLFNSFFGPFSESTATIAILDFWMSHAVFNFTKTYITNATKTIAGKKNFSCVGL